MCKSVILVSERNSVYIYCVLEKRGLRAKLLSVFAQQLDRTLLKKTLCTHIMSSIFFDLVELSEQETIVEIDRYCVRTAASVSVVFIQKYIVAAHMT